MSTFTERVYAMVRRVPRGQVVSYGGVAALLGHPRAARGVGQALRALPHDADVPWWRVINRNGEISIRGDFHAPQLQRALLEGDHLRRDSAFGIGIVIMERAVSAAHAAIVLVNPVARRDGLRGKADDLSELDHRLARRQRLQGKLVPLGHAAHDRVRRRRV